MAQVRLYNVVTTVDMDQTDAEGNMVTIPAGTVINTILWDGVTPYQPPPDTRLELATQ